MNTKHIDVKYVNLLSSKLKNFKWKTSNLANCSCPICGDSKKNKSKSRGYFYFKQNKCYYKCHNCGICIGIFKLLDKIDFSLAKQYKLEKYLQFKSDRPVKTFSDGTEIKQVNKQDNYLKGLICCNKLNKDHIARQYLDKRKIPLKYYHLFYYTDNFSSYINQFDITKKLKEEPRLVLPLLDCDKKIFAVQGRALDNKSELRYITIKFEDKPKIFGLERVNINKRVYVTEGPIDSLFLDNAIAMAGSSLSDLRILKKENTVFVFDNEPRNKELNLQIDSVINSGYNICLVPEEYSKYGKDLNDMIMNGIDIHELAVLVEKNTYSGLKAKLVYNVWKKC